MGMNHLRTLLIFLKGSIHFNGYKMSNAQQNADFTHDSGEPSVFLPRPIGLGHVTGVYLASVLHPSAQILSSFELQYPPAVMPISNRNP